MERRCASGNPRAAASASICSAAEAKRFSGARSQARLNHASNAGPSVEPRSDAGGHRLGEDLRE